MRRLYLLIVVLLGLLIGITATQKNTEESNIISYIKTTNVLNIINSKSPKTVMIKGGRKIIVNTASDVVLPYSRGGMEISNHKRVEFHITYYSNINNRLEGGQYDKIGKRLTSHNKPVIALPSDIKYGAIVLFDEPVNGATEYISVDTGSKIQWVNDEKTICKADIFIPNVSKGYIETHYQNKIVYGWLINY